MLDRRLTVNASIYYEDWRHIQLEAYPNDWALNINGNYASHLRRRHRRARRSGGGISARSRGRLPV
jgi:hypothetical protein